jgi:uncharacterized membrane protein (UPF0127 family)
VQVLTGAFRRAAAFPSLLCVLVAVFAGCSRAEVADDGLQRTTLTIVTLDGARHDYQVEVAQAADEQAKGLMYRREMERDRGMIFPFRPARPASFWMANTYIPLDMIFIREDGRIESIIADVEPLSENQRRSLGQVAAVLELNAGEAARIGAHAGDTVEYDVGGLPARRE